MSWFENIVEKACRRAAKLAPAFRLITRGDNEPYLERYYYFRRDWTQAWFKNRGWQTPAMLARISSVCLHHFLKGDDEEELHNHPCKKSYALILTGGYHEERRQGNGVVSRILRPGSLNVIRDTDFHKVELLDKKRGVWTLFITLDRNPDERWGFWHPATGRYLDWKDHVSLRELRNNVVFVWPVSKTGEA